jgi:two-component system NarL family sensor kinase
MLMTMKKLLLMLLLAPAMALAQTPKIDSLKLILAKTQPDTQRVNLLNKIASGLIDTHATEGFKYANEAITLSQKLDYKRGLGYGYYNRGQMFFSINKSDSSKFDYTVAVKIFKEIKNLRGLASLYQAMGRMLEVQSKHPEAVAYYQQSANISEKLKDDLGTAGCLTLIGSSYCKLNEFDKALAAYDKALAIRTRLKDELAVARTLGGIGVAYRNKGYFYTDKKCFVLAVKNMMQARTIFLKFEHLLFIAFIDKEIGITYQYLEQYKNGLRYLLEAEDRFKKIDSKRELGSLYKSIGNCYLGLKRYPEAKIYFERGLTASIAEKNQLHTTESYERLYDYYKQTGNIKMSLLYHEKWAEENDSLAKRTNFEKLSEVNTRFETEKKEHEIKLLSKENTIQKLSLAKHQTIAGITAGIFIVLLLVGGLLYNRNKHKQKIMLQQQMLKQQEQLTQAIIDAEEKERRRIASDLHDGVGQMFSAVKMNLNGLVERVKFEREEDRFLAEKTVALVDESCKEVRVISHQMMPNMLLRSGIASDVKSFIEKIDSERLKVNVEANGFKNKLESNVEIVLYRVIQETVNNVIKHAQATELNIILNRDAEGITAIVADNGVGFNTDLKDDFGGIGLKNIAARIEYLKGSVTYKSSTGNGTSVNIWVPVA